MITTTEETTTQEKALRSKLKKDVMLIHNNKQKNSVSVLEKS